VIGSIALVLANCDADDADNILRNHHPSAAKNEQISATNSFNEPKRNGSRAHVDQRGDQTDKEGVADRVQTLEKYYSVIEDEVDSSKLLHHLQTHAQKGTSKIAAGVKDATLKAIGPASEVRSLWNNRQLIFVVSYDFRKLILDIF